MAQIEAKVWTDLRLHLAESLLYDPETDELILQDLITNELLFIDLHNDPDGKTARRIKMEAPIGVIAQIEGDTENLLAAGFAGHCLLNKQTGKRKYLNKFYPPEEESKWRANDGCVDAKGRIWGGTFKQFKPEDILKPFAPEGFLFRFDPDGSLHRVLEGMTVPNGMNFSADNKTFYLIDTYARSIFAYDYDLELGTIGNERVLIRFEDSLGVPDGAHIDENDVIWAAMPRGNANSGIVAVDPGNRQAGDGKIVYKVKTDTATMAVVATFGGKDMKDLYIGTAISPDEKEVTPSDGRLFKAPAPAKGVVRKKFGPLTAPSTNGEATYKTLPVSPWKLGELGSNITPAPASH